MKKTKSRVFTAGIIVQFNFTERNKEYGNESRKSIFVLAVVYLSMIGFAAEADKADHSSAAKDASHLVQNSFPQATGVLFRRPADLNDTSAEIQTPVFTSNGTIVCGTKSIWQKPGMAN